jgi:hypothetical protein
MKMIEVEDMKKDRKENCKILLVDFNGAVNFGFTLTII